MTIYRKDGNGKDGEFCFWYFIPDHKLLIWMYENDKKQYCIDIYGFDWENPRQTGVPDKVNVCKFAYIHNALKQMLEGESKRTQMLDRIINNLSAYRFHNITCFEQVIFANEMTQTFEFENLFE